MSGNSNKAKNFVLALSPARIFTTKNNPLLLIEALRLFVDTDEKPQTGKKKHGQTGKPRSVVQTVVMNVSWGYYR